MVSWSSGKLEEASNRSNNAKPSALKQDFLAKLDGAQPVYRTLQQLQDLGQASGQLPSFLQQCSGPHLWPEPTGRAGMMCFWVSRTLNAQHDAGWHHRGFLCVAALLLCSSTTPITVSSGCLSSGSEVGDAPWGLPGASREGLLPAASWRNAAQSVRPARVTPGKPAQG